jgi:uncharacterized protein (TIGR02757 family)
MNFHSRLDKLYTEYNKPELIHPDPLEFLGSYDDVKDREIVGLIAATLAYGRVAQILKSVQLVVDGMKPSPYSFLKKSSERQIRDTFKGFKHRFSTDADLSNLLIGIKYAIEKFGSLNACFLNGYDDSNETIQPALASFVEALVEGGGDTNLLSDPAKGSACKRLHLFLRWMVREDDVDPGGWSGIPRSKLIVPLDTHMHKIGLGLNMTKRRQGNLRTAVEITRAFAKICPDDPTKYDFTLTRFGIRDDMNMEEMFGLCRG